MNETLLRHWWLLALRGTVAILFGVLALIWPALTLVSLAALFAAFALVGGAVWSFAAVGNRRGDRQWWFMLVLGLVSMVAGALAMLYPGLSVLVLVLLIGANALVTGIIDAVVAIRIRKFIKGEWLLMLGAIASIVFGLVVLMFPLGAGALALAWLIGMYAIVIGVLHVLLSLRVRAWWRLHAGRSSPAAGAV